MLGNICFSRSLAAVRLLKQVPSPKLQYHVSPTTTSSNRSSRYYDLQNLQQFSDSVSPRNLRTSFLPSLQDNVGASRIHEKHNAGRRYEALNVINFTSRWFSGRVQVPPRFALWGWASACIIPLELGADTPFPQPYRSIYVFVPDA